jgi:hypothetical protein
LVEFHSHDSKSSSQLHHDRGTRRTHRLTIRTALGILEARFGTGFVRRRPLGGADVAIGSIHSAGGCGSRPDSGRTSVISKSRCSGFASGHFRSGRHTGVAAEPVHTRDIIRPVGQRTASRLSKRRQLAGRQINIRTKCDNEGCDHGRANIIAASSAS